MCFLGFTCFLHSKTSSTSEASAAKSGGGRGSTRLVGSDEIEFEPLFQLQVRLFSWFSNFLSHTNNG